MSDLTKLKEILNNQNDQQKKLGDWDRIDYRIDKSTYPKSYRILKINNFGIGFVFNSRGRLIRAYRRNKNDPPRL